MKNRNLINFYFAKVSLYVVKLCIAESLGTPEKNAEFALREYLTKVRKNSFAKSASDIWAEDLMLSS